MGSRAYPISYIASKRRSLTATATQFIEEFPVLPVSHALLTIDAQSSASNVTDTPLNMLGKISNISITFRGMSIWSLNAADLARLAIPLISWDCPIYVTSLAVPARHILTLVIPFGRKPFAPMECFPATTRGECQCIITTTADPGTYNTYVYTLEWVQLPDAQPAQFIRATALGITPNSTGDFDVDLPRGAPLIGMGVVTTNSEPATTLSDIESIKILMANQDTWYSSAFIDSLRPMVGLMSSEFGTNSMTHTHVENTAGAYAQNATTLTQVFSTGVAREFAWMPFDPGGDGLYSLDGTKALDLKARITFNAANAIRLLPVELWTPSMLGKPNGKG